MTASSGRPSLQRALLRAFALVALIAAPAVLLPRVALEKVSWVMGFGQPPMTPVALYMMAGGAAVYLGQAVLMWVISCDVVRYQPLVRLIAWMLLICGPLFLWIDSQVGLPGWWRLMDGAGSLAGGSALIWACYFPPPSS
ncbi:MAG: hypothetical protein IAE77_01845 [Prosthecobacter sp.]|jgi:hypothetical protein|uniref:hypothetical protein n=1 Tax=Prosthecobacter sp. TaxID=1965333 RepID=UPI0019E800CD|nr:hypothetical protein [Prosthecobacter sp.]MBE2282186.1 hypothetical protein [Prosthecobacter sp.]